MNGRRGALFLLQRAWEAEVGWGGGKEFLTFALNDMSEGGEKWESEHAHTDAAPNTDTGESQTA